jgi:hypothetical protein
MDALSTAARSLERHARALDRLADDLRHAAPPAGTPTAQAWNEHDMDGRIRAMRREARNARRTLKRVRDAQRRHAPAAAPMSAPERTRAA